MNFIRQSLAEGDIVNKLKELFKGFKSKWQAYHDTLGSEEDIETSDEYKEQDNYINILELSLCGLALLVISQSFFNKHGIMCDDEITVDEGHGDKDKRDDNSVDYSMVNGDCDERDLGDCESDDKNMAGGSDCSDKGDGRAVIRKQPLEPIMTRTKQITYHIMQMQRRHSGDDREI
ncbi:hypothetical protein HOLleu_02883 [Holothuria leucospilota]|uniref:Uncharacterized protein n=1 Tax=Holothuria leucospilota TaxID=206669 RepID=A0A9Q1HLM7_HOLLE|nr:hypothetical protein HOLleu_02883 [Holothuria leucospilota]